MKAEQFCRQAREGPLTPEQVRALVRERERFGTGNEERCLEFKRGLAHQGPRKRADWNKLLVEGVSMANAGGGYIVFGVSDDGDLVGISERVVDLLDPARIQDQLRRYSPNASLSTRLTVTIYYGKKYAALWVQPTSRIIVFDETGHYETENGEPKQAFKAGVLYSRDPGGRRRAPQSDVDRMVSTYVEDRLSEVVAKIEQVISVPAEADLIAAHPENPTRGYRLVARGEGRPVRITSEPEEASVPLREVFRPDLPYSRKADEVYSQVRFWKNKPDHRVSRDACFSWYLSRDEIEWDVESSMFCLLSACANWGYPMFWARELFRLDSSALHKVLSDIAESPSHPEIEYVPYVGAAFYWNKKDELFDRVEESGYKRAAHIARKIRSLDNAREFVLRGRSSTPNIYVAGEEYVKQELFESRDIARQIFETVVEMRHRSETGEVALEKPEVVSSAGHQLDLICHARLPGSD